MGVSHFSLLRILADGRFHAGERLGLELGISPARVLDFMQRIEELGLGVSRVRGRGYRLIERIDLLDRGELSARLAGSVPEIRLEVLDECPSTNTMLMGRAAVGASHGSVLACEHQSEGRGRRRNRWVSAPGASVAFSILWRFSGGGGALAGLSLAVGVSVVRALEQLGARGIGVKWPNDIYWCEKKLGGILVEVAGDIRGPSAAVIGIGVNVRLHEAMHSRIGLPAADLALCMDVPPSRTVLLASLLESLATVLARFSREGFAPFREEWLQRHAWQGRRVALSLGERRVAEGEIVGIAEDGALILDSPRGAERFHAGELSLRQQ